MPATDLDLLARLPLRRIESVTFYKIDEVTTDLICCAVQVDGKVRTFHEDLDGWDLLLEHLAKLPGFDRNWFAQVSQPPFATRETVAFRR
jgi:hypothetical protein